MSAVSHVAAPSVIPNQPARLIKNSASILASQLWFPLLSLVATPYIVYAMGVERYGVFSVLPVVGGYLSYLDLGFGWAIIKFVAEHEARADEETLRRTVATGLLTTMLGGCLGGLLLVSLARSIATRVLQLPPALVDEATFAVAISGITFTIGSGVGVLNGILKGIHRFDVTSVIQVSFGTATIVGTVAVLYAGHGLPAVCMVGAVMSAVSLVAHLLILHRLRPSLCVAPRFYRAEFGRMFGFSAFTTVNRVGMTAIMQADKLIVGAMLPVAALSYYAIAFTIAQKVNLFASNVATVLFPVASAQFASGGREQYKRVYKRAAQIVFVLTVIPTVVLAMFAKDFLRAWLGPAFAANSSTPLILLAVGFAAVSVGTVEAISIEGAGHPRVTAAFVGASGALNLVLCPLLTRAYGITGTAAAVATSFLMLAGLNILFFNTHLIGVRLAGALRANYFRPVVMTVLTLASAYAALSVGPGNLLSILATMSAVAFVLGGAGIWVVLNRSEQQALKAFVVDRVSLRP